jgi:hypothetical protein
MTHTRIMNVLFCLLATVALGSTGNSQWSTVGGNSSRNGYNPVIGPEQGNITWVAGGGSQIVTQPFADDNVILWSNILSLQDILAGTTLRALDVHTGAILWQTMSIPGVPQTTGWRIRSCGLHSNTAYLTRSGNGLAAKVVAVNAADGVLKWVSQADIRDETSEGVAFAGNGDLIVQGVSQLLRIDVNSGSTVWSTPRLIPTTGGSEVACYGNRVYGWESGPKVTAYDLSTGTRLYDAGSFGGFLQQGGLLVSQAGIILAPRTVGMPATLSNIYGIVDTGSALAVQWSVPLAYCPFSTFGTSPDGFVFSYSQAQEVIKISIATGQVVAHSIQIGATDAFQPRMSVAANGWVYVTNGSFGNGQVFCFDSSLSPVWTISGFNSNLGGAVLTHDGSLLVGWNNGIWRIDRSHPNLCIGDGVDQPCPCGNSGSVGRGCNASIGTGGALLIGSGPTLPDGVVLSCNDVLPSSLCVFLQGQNYSTPGVTFGDGVRCVSGLLKRIYTKQAVGGVVMAPESGDSSISAMSALLGDPIAPGENRYYQVYYRDPDLLFCTSSPNSSFNVSNVVGVTW